MLTEINDGFKEFRIKINKKKTDLQICKKQALNSYITIEIKKLETVQQFTYLRSKITHNENSKTTIKSKIAQTKQAFYKKRNMFKAKNISFKIRKTLIEGFV